MKKNSFTHTISAPLAGKGAPIEETLGSGLPISEGIISNGEPISESIIDNGEPLQPASA